MILIKMRAGVSCLLETSCSILRLMEKAWILQTVWPATCSARNNVEATGRHFHLRHYKYISSMWLRPCARLLSTKDLLMENNCDRYNVILHLIIVSSLPLLYQYYYLLYAAWQLLQTRRRIEQKSTMWDDRDVMSERMESVGREGAIRRVNDWAGLQ